MHEGAAAIVVMSASHGILVTSHMLRLCVSQKSLTCGALLQAFFVFHAVIGLKLGLSIA